MDTSPHNTSRQTAPIEPPDLNDGWKSAELTVLKYPTAAIEPPDLNDGLQSAEFEVWKDPQLTARKRSVAVRVVLAVLVLTFAIGVPLWIAATHYARGVEALSFHQYDRAVDEFSAARILVFPYRDARSLGEQAGRALVAEDTRRQRAEARQATVVALLNKAAVRLEAGDAAGVLAALQKIRMVDLQTVADGSEAVQESADALAEDLAAASRTALSRRAWGRAGSYAAAVLVLKPSSELAATLGVRAAIGEDLSAKLGKAKDLARHGKWRVALRMALAVLAAQKDFPGATAVVADARHALAPKPKPAKTQTASTTTTASPPTQPVTKPTAPTPPQPPAPP